LKIYASKTSLGTKYVVVYDGHPFRFIMEIESLESIVRQLYRRVRVWLVEFPADVDQKSEEMTVSAL